MHTLSVKDSCWERKWILSCPYLYFPFKFVKEACGLWPRRLVFVMFGWKKWNNVDANQTCAKAKRKMMYLRMTVGAWIVNRQLERNTNLNGVFLIHRSINCSFFSVGFTDHRLQWLVKKSFIWFQWTMCKRNENLIVPHCVRHPGEDL